MRLALLIFLLSVCSAAHAVPLIVAAAGALSTAGVITAATAAIFSLAVIAAQTVYGISKARSDRRKARNEYNANLKDQLTTTIETDSSARYVYGETRVGSSIVAMLASGDKDQYKHLVCVHAAHECESIEEVYINGKALGTLTGDGFVTSGDFYKEKVRQKKDVFDAEDGQVLTLSRSPSEVMWVYQHNTNPSSEDGIESRNFTVDGDEVTITDPAPGNPADIIYVAVYHYIDPQPTIRVKKHLGTPGEAADASLIAEVPSKWTSAHKLSGLCYTVVRLDLNEPEFQGGPPSVEVLLRGAKLYDPRTETTVWSDNPALVAYHYLTSEMCGIPAADLPVAKFITAANVCDESFSFGKRYTLNGAVSADQSQADVLEDMAEAMAGTIVATTWDITAGKYIAPVMSFVVDSAEGYGDVVGSFAITPGVAKADLFNGVRGQYLGSDVGYIVTDFKPYQNSTYVTADGGELWMDKTFPFTDNTRRVHNLARIQTEQLRNSYTVKAEFSLKAWKLKVGDRVSLSSEVFGWSDKVFVVLSKRYSPTSTVELTLKEDAASIWDFADDVSADATPNTDLPNPFAIAPLASLTCASGSDHLLLMGDGTIVSRMHVSWPQTTTQAVFTNGLIEVEFQSPDEEAWQKAQVTGDETEIYLSPVKDGHPYTVRARTVNPYMNVKSEWHYTFHTVVGKTEAPPDVTGFDVTQLADATRRFSFDTDNQPVDVSSGGGYRIKYRTDGSGTTWENMTLLHNGLITASPYETMLPAAGTYDFAIAAVDSSGNESENATLDSGVTITEDSDGSEALALLADLANDNILTKNEKPRLILEVNELLDEFVENRVQADNFSVSRVDYDKKFWELYDYLGTLTPSYDNLSADTVIVGATLRQKFADVYLVRQVMLNAIATEAANRAIWEAVTGDGKPSDNATSDLKLVAGVGTATVAGNVAQKLTGAGGWDSDVYSLDSYTGGAYASAIPATTDKSMMFGLNSDPTTDGSFSSIDYALYFRSDAVIGIYESGVSAGAFGSYTTDDVFAITYDGVNVRYMKNGAVIRTVAAAADLNLFFDSSFNSVGGKMTNLRFGPMVSNTWVAIGGSGKPADNAQVNAPGLGIKINQSTFSNSSPGEAYIHGYTDAGAAADVDGFIFWNGAKITVPKGYYINTDRTGLWYILFDKAERDLWGGGSITGAEKVGDVWTWRRNGGTGTVTIDADIIVIGAIYATGTELITHGTIWTEAVSPANVKGIIDTSDMAANAATEVITTTATNVAVTYSSATDTTIASINFTPTVTGTVVLTLVGEVENEGQDVNPVFMASSEIKLKQSVTNAESQAITIPGTHLFSDAGNFSYGEFSRSSSFSVTAGTAYTFSALIHNHGNGSETTVLTAELRLEAIKR